jgi:hypothetical protein
VSKIESISLKGKSGKKYLFYVYHFDTSFKELGAVYIVTRRYKNINGRFLYEKIYIGQTENLSLCFINHTQEDCFNQYSANCICTCAEESEKIRLDIKSDLIENYNPPCND